MEENTTFDYPIASTKNGDVAGRFRNDVELFAGIPYASPPVGDLRFAAPVPPDNWEGVRDAKRFGAASPQLPGEGLTDRFPVRWDEDCLYLNVVTPSSDDEKRPVYVWIHGGAYRKGQGGVAWYDGTSFASRGDVVVVTINYRLGAFGFTELGEHFGEKFSSSGLNGLLDQIAALQWVQDNIASFGGDPDQVTVGGESAGAFSVANLLASPLAKGLFHRAIAQSGAAFHIHEPEAGAKIASELLEALGNPTSEEILDLPAIDILEAQEALIEKWGFAARGVQPFYPVWGHEALPEPPIDLIGKGSSSDIPLLIGTNEDEMSLYGFTDLDDGTLFRYVERIVDNPKEVIDSYRERIGDDSGWLACAIGSDWVFRIPAIRLAETREDHDGNTWMYLFSWDSRAFEGRFGSAHSLELPFTFNTLDRAGVNIFIGEGELPTHVAEAMHDAWISFIRDGNPSTAVLGEWPTYTTENRAVMEINDDCDLLIDPQSEERSLWDGVR